MKNMEQRRIKFRIWDNENNRWYEPIYEAYAGRLEDLSLSPSGQLCMRRFKDGTHIEESVHESIFPERFIYQQFTGLLCHGDEVYEGDLLQRSSSTGKGTVIGEVYFDEGQFKIKWHPKERGWNSYLYIHLPECEIIGNIYEHSNLLNP